MSVMTVTGSVDPLLSVRLEEGETLYAERNAMVCMDSTLALTGGARGGLFKALGRKILNDETFFQQKIEAQKGSGEVLLAPTLPGAIELIECGDRQYMLADGSYLASESGVEIETRSQGLGRALLGNSGGLFVMHTQGKGHVAVSGLGSIRVVQLDGTKSVFVDNGHLVAWDDALKYELAVNTAGKGFFGKLLHSQTSGEGIVLKFSGRGKLLVASRNRGGFIDWILGQMPENKVVKN